jgi:hypothetical protein
MAKEKRRIASSFGLNANDLPLSHSTMRRLPVDLAS